MQAFDMPAPDIDQVLRRNGVGIRLPVFEPDVKASGMVLMLPPWAIAPSDIRARRSVRCAHATAWR